MYVAHHTTCAPTAPSTHGQLTANWVDSAAPTVPPLEADHAISEAISLPDMVHATCIELRPLLAHHQVTLLLNGDARGLPWVFGNRARLRAALWECMEAAIVHARLEVDTYRSLAMEIVFSTDASQVHLTIRNLGAIETVTLGEPGSGLTPQPGQTDTAALATESRQHLVFPFARVLLQSLGGQVVVRQPAGGGVECTVSLPGLADADVGNHQPTHHSHIYAGLLTRMASNDHLPLRANMG